MHNIGPEQVWRTQVNFIAHGSFAVFPSTALLSLLKTPTYGIMISFQIQKRTQLTN